LPQLFGFGREQMMPPTTAVQIPAIGGNPLALAIAGQSGIAIKKTRNPPIMSADKFRKRALASGGAGFEIEAAE
jgi:hypothetical protein